MNQRFLSIVLSMTTSITWATDASYWQCATIDQQENQWTEKSSYERVAMNRAYDACKKNSTNPSSCKTSKASCEYFSNGLSTRPAWQCTALDLMAMTWPSNISTNRDDAAIQAKAYCEQKSSMPETCYINLLTCKNLNEITL